MNTLAAAWLSISIVLGFSTDVAADSTITQAEFLDILERRHPYFRQQLLTTDVEKARRQSLLGDRDWRVHSSLTFLHEEPAFSFAGPEQSDIFSLTAGVERNFWNTGGRFNATYSFDRIDLELDPLFPVSDEYFRHNVSIGYTQPLLQNRGGLLDRIGYDLKEYDIALARVTAAERLEDFLASSSSRFLDWVFTERQIDIIQERLRLSEEELANVRRKREANLVDRVDVIRAEDAVRVARQDLLMARSRWKALQAELAVLAQDTSLYHKRPKFDLYNIVTTESLDKLIDSLPLQSRVLNTLQVQVEQLRHSRRIYDEQLKPNLDLVSELRLKEADPAFGTSLVIDKPDILVGLQFSVPLERRQPKARITETDLLITQLTEQRHNIELELASALSNVYIRMMEMEDILDLNREQIESARLKTQEELDLYDQGRGELTFVIQSRDSEEAAKLNLARNAHTYQKLHIEFLALQDRLYVPPKTGE